MPVISKGRGITASDQVHALASGRSGLLQAAVALTLMSSRVAMAAEDAPKPGATSEGPAAVLTEVAVTARRIRPDDQTSATGLRMTLVETPQAITIVTPEMMQLAGANNIYQATDLVPGMQATGSGYGLDRIIMRGNLIGSHRLNGTAFSVGHALDSSVMERIEVVRGPATALYGVTGSFGGEINNILKSPQDVFDATIGFEAGDFDLARYEMDVTGPIAGAGSRLAGRLVGSYEDSSAPVDVADINNHKYTVAGSLKFEFSENTTARVWLLYSDLNEDPYDGGSLQQLSDGMTLVLPAVPADDWYYSDDRYSLHLIEEKFAIADLQHRLSNDWQFKTQATISEYEGEIGLYYTFGPFGAYDLPDDEAYFYSYDQQFKNKELTFNMSLGGDFELMDQEHQFLAALEYNDHLDPNENLLFNSLFLGYMNMLGGGRGVLADGSPVPLIDRSTLTPRLKTHQSSTDYRLSLQLLLNPTDRLSVLVGALYQDTEIESSVLIDDSVVIPEPVVETDGYNEMVGRAGITYQLAKDRGAIDAANIYFNYSEGFNPNLGVQDADGNPLTTPQVMEQYEVGIKGEFLNHAIGASLAIYDSTLTNIPVSLNYLGEFGNAGETLEGERNVKGIEVEVVGQIRPGLNVAANYAYTDSEISDPNYDFTAPVKSVPRHQGALFASYEFLDGALRGLKLGGSVVSLGDYTFVPSLANIERFGQLKTGAHTRVGLSMSYLVQADWGRGMELYANGINVFDEKIYTAKEDHPGFGITRELARAFTFGMRYTFGQR